jgi:hypothetical protein
MTTETTAQTMFETATVPRLGQIVDYRLSDSDAASINAGRAAHGPHLRNLHSAGQICPAMIVRIWGGQPVLVQLQVFYDGAGTHWATSRREGDQPGMWRPQIDG